MSARIVLPALLIAFATPAAAESLHETHRLMWQPIGKTPAAMLRPVERSSCRATGFTPIGKLATAAPAAACERAVAARSAAR